MFIRVKSVVLLFVLLALAAPVYGIDIFPVSDLRPGMTGIGYTVINGTEVESFSVEIVGVMPRSGQTGDRIIVRAFGDVIDRAGGVAQGMSGSPVYIDHQLVGAIGYGWGYTDHQTAMLTSAEDMVRLLQLIPDMPSDKSQQALSADDAVLDQDATPLMAPMSASGFGHRTRTLLDQVFGPLNNMTMIPGGSSAGSSSSAPSISLDSSATSDKSVRPFVGPGAAIAALLVRGDVEIGSVGTLTELSGDRFVAFAHPWFHRGNVSYFLNGFSVLMTMPSLQIPFKIGTVQGPIGVVLQDREAGLAGLIGQDPPSVSLEVMAKDNDVDRTQHLSVQVVRDPSLSPTLLAISALEGLDRTLDRIGPGTAKVRFIIEGDHLPRPIERENLFYSASDIAGLALSEFYDALLRISGNAFVAPELTSVAVQAEIDEGRKTAHIERARPMRRRVRAGDEVQVMVTLVPFRSSPVEIAVPVTIPKETAPGPLTITVRGGNRDIFSPLSSDFEEYLEGTSDMEWDELGDIQSDDGLLRLIEDIESVPKSNDIIFEFYPVLNDNGDNGTDPRADHLGDSEHAPSMFLPMRTVYASEYVVRGLHSIEVLVTPAPEVRLSVAADADDAENSSNETSDLNETSKGDEQDDVDDNDLVDEPVDDEFTPPKIPDNTTPPTPIQPH